MLFNLAQRVIEALLFFHPAVWFVSRCVSEEREHACDDMVVATGCGSVEYADALVRMAEVSAAFRGVAVRACVLAASGEKSCG